MNFNINTVSARDIQKNYRKIFDKVKEEDQPVYVMSKNKPDVVIVSINYLNNLKDHLDWEVRDTKEAIEEYKLAKKNKKLIKLKDPKELLSI